MTKTRPDIDFLKGLAAILILLHHWSIYGPTSLGLSGAWMDFLRNEARYVVQIFLVVGGYLAMQSWLGRLSAPSPSNLAHQKTVLHAITIRFLRLAPEVWICLAATVGITWLAREVLASEPWVSSLPSWQEFLIQSVKLQDFLGVDALASGIWYVAIDFQLYLMLSLLWLWIGPRPPIFLWSVVALGMLSLLYFSKAESLDHLGPYFFFAYAVGIVAAWCSERAPAQARPGGWIAGVALVVVALLDFSLEFRERPALALATGLVLLRSSRITVRQPTVARCLAFMGKHSYAIFLVHYPVLLAGTALWNNLIPPAAEPSRLASAIAGLAVLSVTLLLAPRMLALCNLIRSRSEPLIPSPPLSPPLSNSPPHSPSKAQRP